MLRAIESPSDIPVIIVPFFTGWVLPVFKIYNLLEKSFIYCIYVIGRINRYLYYILLKLNFHVEK